MHAAFILVRPSYPSNIGSAARALKTMGFSDLRLVAPRAEYHHERAYALATHASDILDHLKVFDNLQEASADLSFTIGTSHRTRKGQPTPISSKDLREFLDHRESMIPRVGFVFGPESTGLNNTEAGSLDALVSIPTQSDQPSLNLAQAIMIIAYEASNLSVHRTIKQKRRLDRQASQIEYKHLRDQYVTFLNSIGIEKSSTLARQIISKIDQARKQDFHLLYKLKDRLERHIRH